MRVQPTTIALGDKAWRVRPLTVAQVQEIEPLLLCAAEAKTGSVAGAVAVLKVALARDHADALADFDQIEASAGEIASAMTQVLRLGGFLPDGDRASGEADAGRDVSRPTGPHSTPA